MHRRNMTRRLRKKGADYRRLCQPAPQNAHDLPGRTGPHRSQDLSRSRVEARFSPGDLSTGLWPPGQSVGAWRL